ncbi:MAG: glycosyltransferase family 2 protein [Planctomycetes bacterium]|nr:glycosyltransferase family 2 protein [Planctomycetota bacterium]
MATVLAATRASAALYESKRQRSAPMQERKKVIIVMPAYNAEKTLERTLEEIPPGTFDEIVMVDDCSGDHTVEKAKALGLLVVTHPQNRGYGGNQKTCYRVALERGADVVVMLHPDCQYDPRIVPNMALPILQGQADCVLASRFIRDPLHGGPIKGGMPVYKFICNRVLTWVENVLLGTYFSEFHTGYRAFSRRALEAVRLQENSDNFVFDNEIIVQLMFAGATFRQIPVETRYFADASSVGFFTAVRYGFGVLRTTFRGFLHRTGLKRYPYFEPKMRLEPLPGGVPFKRASARGPAAQAAAAPQEPAKK